MAFTQGDYTYTYILSKASLGSVSLSYGQSYTYTLSYTPITEDNDEETYIYLGVLDHEEGGVSFSAGQAAHGYCRQVLYIMMAQELLLLQVIMMLIFLELMVHIVIIIMVVYELLLQIKQKLLMQIFHRL